MKRCRSFTLMCFCLLGFGTAFSQILSARPPVDLFLGYSYINADGNNLASRRNVNGWSTSSSVNFSRWVALEADAGGYYRSNTLTSNGTEYSFAAGPRLNFRPFFVHALFGDDHLSEAVSSPSVSPAMVVAAGAAGGTSGGGLSSSSSGSSSTSTSASQDSFAMIFGGGVQWKVARSWSLRASVDYLRTHHDLSGAAGAVQNNLRVGGGLVYTLHSRQQRQIVARE